MTGIQKIILHTLTVVGEYEPAQFFFLVLLLPKLQTPTVHLKNPPRRQKLLRCLDAVTRAARALLCGRHTDRGCGQSTVMTGGLDPLFAFALGNTKCSARLLHHRNYFQRQPEHVEDEFMHHNGKNEITTL